MSMKLPQIDPYRAPLIEPLGHLVMQSALADEALISLLAVVPYGGSPEQIAEEDAAHPMRNWGSIAESFIETRLALIPDEYLKGILAKLIVRYKELRIQRHRAVHDAISIWIVEEENGTHAKTFSTEFKRDGPTTVRRNHHITPEKIADLACELDRLQRDLTSWASHIEGLSAADYEEQERDE